MHLSKCSPGSWEVNDAGALEIRWIEGYFMLQESTQFLVYSHGEVNGDDDEIPEMDNNVDLIFEA